MVGGGGGEGRRCNEELGKGWLDDGCLSILSQP